SLKQPAPGPLPPPPPIKLDGIVMGPDSNLQGQVVRLDRTPQANAKVQFVSAQSGKTFTTVSNSAGRFSVTLPSGNWLVYLVGADDIPVYNTQLAINGTQPPGFTLVSR